MKRYFSTKTAAKALITFGSGLCTRTYQIVIVLLMFLLLIELQNCAAATFLLHPAAGSSFTVQQLAVIVNRADPLSVAIAGYYQQQRQIPDQNMISIEFAPDRTVLSPEEFKSLKTQVDAKTPSAVQGYALTWAAPYRVGCMSITTAFAAGFDQKYCAEGCQATQLNPFFASDSAMPYRDFQIRPTMAIAATGFSQAKALIDRGVSSDGTFPRGTAYLINTSDQARNVRFFTYLDIIKQLGLELKVEVIQADLIENKPDVMFYFTGLTQVNRIETNRFLPGAIADHLTSFGGQLTDSSQMSSLRWLEAGATGSYGSVVEPCSFPQKFPDLRIVMPAYLAGDTLLEAYWKSVAWTGQGIFIGEPLARPFGRSK
jgi:uncharacterized protein (TIGR03790 family)